MDLFRFDRTIHARSDCGYRSRGAAFPAKATAGGFSPLDSGVSTLALAVLGQADLASWYGPKGVWRRHPHRDNEKRR